MQDMPHVMQRQLPCHETSVLQNIMALPIPMVMLRVAATGEIDDADLDANTATYR